MTRVAMRVARGAAWAFLAVLALPIVLQLVPQIVLADRAFVVLSGSMEPLFSPGDVVFVRAIEAPEVGSVITFRVAPGSDVMVTHRIVEIVDRGSGPRYRTHGDANADPDAWLVHPDQVVGEYVFRIPQWGHLQQLVRSRVGYVAFVMVPAAIILAREFRVLYHELDTADRAKRRAKEAAAAPRDALDELFARLEREEKGGARP